ncbi:MAG: hypothetical protein NT062_04390 [Proteobacteria bacterium]|nr:hypothetical protein [Pseudomonadota bacterium]
MIRRIMIVALVGLGLGACAASEADPTPPKKPDAARKQPQPQPKQPKQVELPKPPRPAEPDARFEDDMMTRFHMHENFGLVQTMERNLLAGRLDAAKDLARALAQAPDEPGVPQLVKQAVLVRARALEIAGAKTIDEAVRHDATLLAACATCHVESSAQPEFLKWPPVPPDRATIDARMLRHLWATERLWEGMVGDADASWRAGLDVLASTPLPAKDLGAERTTFANRLQRIAADTKKRPGVIELATRTTAYAEILSTCVACHAIGRTPPHP